MGSLPPPGISRELQSRGIVPKKKKDAVLPKYLTLTFPYVFQTVFILQVSPSKLYMHLYSPTHPIRVTCFDSLFFFFSLLKLYLMRRKITTGQPEQFV
jgi:hypothetical protein